AASPIFFTSCSTMLALVLSPKIVDGLDLPLSSGGFAAAIGSWGRHRRGPVEAPSEVPKGGKAPSESEPGVVPQILHAIGALPGEVGLQAAEVPIGGRLLVDGPAQVEVLDDARRREVEVP